MTHDRDCNTCRHHAQTSTDYPACNDCLRTPSLMYWEPIVTEEVLSTVCRNCKHAELRIDVEPCNSCCHGRGYDNSALKWEPRSQPRRINLDAKPKPENDGSTADYYVLPEGATQLQDLISYRNMNAQMGEIFRATFRYGQGHHSPKERDLKKIIFYAQQELERIKKYES